MDDMTTLSVTLHNAIAEIGRDAWEAVRPDANPFTSYDFLHALETSRSVNARSGWQATHLALRDGDRVTGVMPLYVKYHSMGEYVFDHAWARAYEEAGGDYYPKLLSAVPFTPVTGARLLARDAATRRALAEAAVKVCDGNRLSSLHVNFPAEDEWRLMGDCGLLLRQDQQFWFDNPGYASFDDFLAQLSSNRRKVIRRERRDVQALLDFRVVTGSDIEERHLDDMYAFIADTYARKWGTGKPYLTRAFFSEVAGTMRDRIVLVFAYDAGKAVAGAINFTGDGVLYGRQWGALVDVPFLHFEVCYYQAIDYAIASGLRRVEAGTQGEHKLSRGYLPHPVYSAHYIRDARLRRPVTDYLAREREAVAETMVELAAEASPFKKGG